MRTWLKLLMSLFVAFGLWQPAFADRKSSEEMQMMRRVASFWKEGNLDLTEQEGRRFVQEYPNGPFTDSLRSILGQVYLRTSRFHEAYTEFQGILREDLREQTAQDRLFAAYKLGYYDLVIDEAEGIESGKVDFLVGASHAHKALESIEQQPLEYHTKMAITRLERSDLHGEAMPILARLYERVSENEKAIELYRQLAYEQPGQRESYLFRLGQLEARINVEEGLETLRQVQLLEGDLASEAAFLQAALMSDHQMHERLIGRVDDLSVSMSEGREPLFRYLVGRAYFFEEHYEKSMQTLMPVVSGGVLPSRFEVVGLLIALRSAEKLDRFVQIEALVHQFETSYPEDPELAKALFIRAQSLYKQQERQKAIGVMRAIERRFPDFPELDVVSYLINSYLQEDGKWEAARKGYLYFLGEYPQSKLSTHAINGAAQCSLKLAETDPEWKAALTQDLKKALNETPDQEQFALVLIKTLYEMGRYEEMIDESEAYLAHHSKSQERYRVHFLLALAYHSALGDLEKFVNHGERVLELRPNVAQRHEMLENLAVACFQLGRESELTSQSYFDRCAEYLYALLVEGKTVQTENLLWLGHYYSERIGQKERKYLPVHSISAEEEVFGERADEAFASVWEELERSGGFDEESNRFFEPHYLNWAALQASLQRPHDWLAKLQVLEAAVMRFPEWRWQHRGETQYALALAHEAVGDWTAASANYVPLLEDRWMLDPLVVASSRLQWARLTYNSMSQVEQKPDHPKMMPILDHLDRLATRRVMSQEPIHLESALDKAMMETRHLGAGEKEKALVERLSEIKRLFSSEDDLWAKDYHMSRQSDEQFDALYQSYMLLLDAQIAYLQGVIDHRAGRERESAKRIGAARSMFAALLDGSIHATEYVAIQARASLESMEETPAFADHLWQTLTQPRAAPRVN